MKRLDPDVADLALPIQLSSGTTKSTWSRISGLLSAQVEQVWSRWHPLVWRITKRRGCIAAPDSFHCV